MYIQWFPGHMTKALRMMDENVRLVDSIIYLLDARSIHASFNPSFDKLIKNKSVLYIINKCDLVEKSDVDKWREYFTSRNLAFIMTASVSSKDKNKIVDSLKRINKDLIARYKAKGVNKTVRAMVIGIPNSGKSTLINSLCGKKRAITGDRPGVTRGKQWVVLSQGIELLDTPGTVWPKFDSETLATHLAFVGSIKDDILSIEELSIEMIKFFRDNYTENFKTRYHIDSFDISDHEILEQVARRRGFVVSGGDVDTERASRAIVDDFRKGKLGKVMLEMPEDK